MGRLIRRLRVGETRARRGAALAALFCALVVGFAIAPCSAAAEEPGDTAPIQNFGGIFDFAVIHGPEAPENYPFRVNLREGEVLEQLSPTEVAIEFEGEVRMGTLVAEKARDAWGTEVPTTLMQTGPEVVTLTVHHRAGNPAAGGVPFIYPITPGPGFVVGNSTVTVIKPPEYGAPGTKQTPRCEVPSLHDLKLRAAKAKLRTAHCAIGAVHLAAGTGPATGRVVKQFRAAGTELATGAPVAVKLGR